MKYSRMRKWLISMYKDLRLCVTGFAAKFDFISINTKNGCKIR